MTMVDIEELRRMEKGLEAAQFDIRMLFNEALGDGPNMNGDGGSIIHTVGHAHDLIDAAQCIAELRNELTALRAAQQWRGIKSAPRDGTPVEVRVQWRWNGGGGDEADLIDIAHFDPAVNNWVFITAPNYYQQLDARCTITGWRHTQPLPPGDGQ